MSQDFTDDCFSAGNTGTTDLQNIENNFAALKSSFSGANDPSNPVAGLIRLKTATHRLGVRNEANDAYQEIWDMTNNKPIITNLSNEITDTMVAAANKDGAANVASMRTLGTTALTACAGNDARLAQGQFKIGTFTRAMTAASGDVSYTGVGFQPNNILFLAHSTSGSISTGMDNGTSRYAVTTWGTTVPYYSNTAYLSVSMIQSVTQLQTALVKSFDSDGFTLTWTRTGTPSHGDGTVYYMAFK